MKYLLAALILISTSLPALGAPQITADQNNFHFGTLYQGDKVSHIFSFTNTGDEALKVNKVKSSCGCTAAVVSKKLLQPGESGEIKATFDSTRFRGEINKKVYLYSNAPGKKSFDFSIKATVKEVLALKPHRVSAGPLPPGKPHTSIITLTNQWTGAIRITEQKSGLEGLSLQFDRELIEPGGAAELSLTYTPDRSKRRINTYIILKTDNSLTPEVRIPIFLLVDLT